MSWAAEPDSPGRRDGRGVMLGALVPGSCWSPQSWGSQGLTSSTPSASTTRDQVLGFSTKGSPKLFWGTVTKAGSVLGAKTICLVCSVPAMGGMRGCEGTGMTNLGLCSGKQLCGAVGSDRFPLSQCTTIPHCPGTETSTLNLFNSLVREININHCNP